MWSPLCKSPGRGQAPRHAVWLSDLSFDGLITWRDLFSACCTSLGGEKGQDLAASFAHPEREARRPGDRSRSSKGFKERKICQRTCIMRIWEYLFGSWLGRLLRLRFVIAGKRYCSSRSLDKPCSPQTHVLSPEASEQLRISCSRRDCMAATSLEGGWMHSAV